MVSLDKALEVNHLSARVGDNVEIKCDVSGTPPPPIVWRRNAADLASLGEEDVRVFSDGALYLTRIQLVHAGNYTCHAQRNIDVIQTHVLTVHSTYYRFSEFRNGFYLSENLKIYIILFALFMLQRFQKLK